MTSDLFQHEYNNKNHYNHNALTRFLDKINYPDPRNVEGANIDKKIRDGILRINKSNWVWTLFSCSGHKKKSYTPYLVFIVDKKYKGLLLEHIYDSLSLQSTYNNIFPLHGGLYFRVNPGYSDNNFCTLTVYFKKNNLKSYQSAINHLLFNLPLSP